MHSGTPELWLSGLSICAAMQELLTKYQRQPAAAKKEEQTTVNSDLDKSRAGDGAVRCAKPRRPRAPSADAKRRSPQPRFRLTPRRPARDGPWPARFVDRDEGEDGLGHLLAAIGAETPRPGLDMDLDRVRPMRSIAVSTQSTSPTLTGRMNFMASIAIVTTRPIRPFGGRDAARLIHAAQHPAAEDVAIRVGVARHRDNPHGQFATRRVAL